MPTNNNHRYALVGDRVGDRRITDLNNNVEPRIEFLPDGIQFGCATFDIETLRYLLREYEDWRNRPQTKVLQVYATLT